MTARPSRILFACPQTVFDVSNGASMQVYSMLQEFSRRGIETASFCGGVFDDPAGAARIPNLAEQIKENQGKAVLINKDSSANSENPITHWFFTGFHSTVWNEMTHEEETNFLNKYTEVLRTFKPDLVIGYGCDALCRSMWMEARSFGIPTAYIICNGNHHHYRFPLHDIVLCDSKATAKLYKDEDGLTVHPFGNVINPDLVVAKQRNPQTVTFINPAFAKGVAVVARLILMANKWTQGGGTQRLRQKRREEFAQKDGGPVAQASQAASQKAGRRQRLYASGVRALRRGSARLGKLQAACPQETHHQ